MSEPRQKIARIVDDCVHVRYKEQDGAPALNFQYCFLPCDAEDCASRGLFNADRKHHLVRIQVPQLYELFNDGSTRPVETAQPQMGLACEHWVKPYNATERFADAIQWRYWCRLLIKEYPQLAPLASAFKLFGRLRLVGRAITIVDDHYHVDVQCAPGVPMEEEVLVEGEWIVSPSVAKH
jgi:hypothetical protein